MVEQVACDVRDDADREFAVHDGGDAHAVRRVAVEEVGGAVQRIHDPHEVAAPRFRAQLLALHDGLGVRRRQRLGDQGLGVSVHAGDEIALTLELPGGGIGSVEGADEGRATPRGFPRDIE
jgi:hypothetical protein